MNVLVVHNHYRQPGGEDMVFAAETGELARRGVNVVTHTLHNDDVRESSPVLAGLRTVWNPAPARALGRLVREHGIQVVHFHNTFPLVSPAAYWAVRAQGAAVVQTLHNYRLLCAQPSLYRDGHFCTDCVGRTPAWPALRHACYRGSRAATGAVVAMQTAHRWSGTYARAVDVYIALTELARDLHVRGGLPAGKLVVKPNFLTEDPGVGTAEGGHAVFLGRLERGKGVLTLLQAWRGVGARLPLKIVGDGPLAPEVAAAARELPGIEALGWRSREEVFGLLRGARLLVFPSEWPEGLPMSLIEAFACGLPVVAARIGAAASIVEHGVTGRHFQPGDAADLAAQVGWMLDHPGEYAAMRGAARRTYLERYTAESNITQLLNIYARAQERRTRAGPPGRVFASSD